LNCLKVSKFKIQNSIKGIIENIKIFTSAILTISLIDFNKKIGTLTLMNIKILLLHIGFGILIFYLAILFVPGVSIKEGDFQDSLKILLSAGVALGLVNYFLKPLLNLIAAPAIVLTFGFFRLIINMLIVWLVDIFFPQLIIKGLLPLFWIAILICLVNFSALKIKGAKL
jgi:putative membrane protein